MSSGSKGGASTTNEYHGTLAGALGEGPAYSLEWIVFGGKTVWSGPLSKPVGADYSAIFLTGVGPAYFYWGTETQAADSVLASFKLQPAYRGWVYLVLVDCSFGVSGETAAPTIEVCWSRAPNQLIISNGTEQIDGNDTCNPAAVAAEILTSWNFGGLPSDKLNAASFVTLSNDLAAETVAGTNRISSSVAPFWNEKTNMKSALADLSSVSNAWLRMGADGRIEAGRRIRTGVVAGATALTHDDVDSAHFETEDASALPNSFSIEFRNADKHHKGDARTVDNTASVRSTGIVRRKTASRQLLTHEAQVFAHGADLLRAAAYPKTTLELEVKRGKAVNSDGTKLRPGDYFTFPVEEQGEASDIRLFFILRRSFDKTGPITITGELETNGAVQVVVPTPVINVADDATPPVNYSRIVSLDSDVTGDSPSVVAFAARPADMAFWYIVQYCKTVAGDYAEIGRQPAFALPLNLVAAFSNVATTLRVSLLTGSNGVDPRRDSTYLTNWNGGAGEAAMDSMVICLIKKDGGGNIVAKPDGKPWVEFLSVAGPVSAVATDTFDVPVLRARRNTVAAEFSAGSFPDSWATYEVWCAPIENVSFLWHPDFEAPNVALDPSYFRMIPFGNAGLYDPDTAYAEHVRRVADAVTLAEFYPQTSAAYVPQITVVVPDATPAAATDLAAIAGTGKAIGLTWTAIPGAVEYKIFRGTTSDPAASTEIAEQAYPRFVDVTVDVDVPYWYWISGVSAGELIGEKSNSAAITPRGVGGPNAILTNEAHLVPADSAGVVSSFAGASTEIKIYEGVVDSSADWTVTKADTDCTSALVGRVVTVSALSADVGYVDITAARTGYDSIVRRFTITKSKAGTGGTNAKLVVLTSDTQTVQYAKAAPTTPVPATINFTATGQNLAGSPTFSVTSGSATLTVTGTTCAVDVSSMLSEAITVKVVWDGVEDYISIVKVREGYDGVAGNDVIIEYSVDGASWHSTFTVGDLYQHQKVGTTGTFTAAMKIIGDDGTPGDNAYFYFKFSNDGGATFTASGGDVVGKYIGTYSSNSATPSTLVGSYTWILLQGYVETTPPTDPAAPTLNTSSAYLAGDGTALSRLVINVPAMPTGGYIMNVLYRKNGSTGWIVADQWDNNRNPTPRTSTIDDLAPNMSYEVAVQVFTFDLAPSAIVLATGSPFTAPNKSSGPANPTGFVGHAPDSSYPIAAKYWGSTQIYGMTVTFTRSADRDVANYEFGISGSTGTPPSSADTIVDGTAEKVFFYSGTTTSQRLWVRTRDRTGNYSDSGNWTDTGIWINFTLALAAGSMSEQSSANVSMSGVKTGSGSSVRQVLAKYDENMVTSPLTGGAASEIFALDISNRGFSAHPDVGSVQVESDDNVLGRYLAVDGATSTSTTAYIKLWTRDASNIGASAQYRCQISLTEYA
jgi:hypothetical protein